MSYRCHQCHTVLASRDCPVCDPQWRTGLPLAALFTPKAPPPAGVIVTQPPTIPYRPTSSGIHQARTAELEALPEHREEEGYAVDPVFDNGPDTFLPAPADLTGRERLDFEELYKLGGRVIGRHDAVVAKPWYLTVEFVTRRLRCTPAEAERLLASWQALDATEAMVFDFIAQSKETSVQVAMNYYAELAEAVKACEPDAEDALVHVNQGLAHALPDWEEPASDFTPELAVMLSEGVPSAAQIAHDLGISLADAGAIRQDLLLQDLEGAAEIVASCQGYDEDDILDDVDGEAKDDDAVGFRSEGWHLMDDLDDYGPAWLDSQPAQVQVLFHRTECATTLSELKRLGQKVYGLKDWTPPQRSAFWALWKARRGALLQHTELRVTRVRKAVQKIRRARGQDVPELGKRLFAFSKSNPGYYPEEGWAAIWAAYKDARIQRAEAKPSRTELVQRWLETHRQAVSA